MKHRSHLLATTLLAAIAAPAWAQTPAPAATAAADPAVDEGTTIVVTGSLLTNPNLAQAAPVNVTTAEEINLRQKNLAEEVLRDIPGVVPNVGSAVNNGNGGSSFVDLRGLGINRNVVLLDGSRIVPAGLIGSVDLNNIPLALIERVDALTGGASTTYGADAVSGVVNFVTRKDFAGMEISLGEQITEKGDGNFMRADVTLGANFDDGRGNAVLSIGYQESDPVYQGDRDFSVDQIDSFSGTLGGSGTSVPSRFSGTRPLTGGTPNMTPESIFTGRDAQGNPIYVANPGGAANGGVRQVNGQGQAVGTFALFNFNPYNVFQTPFKRYNIYGAAHYQVSDAVEVYTRGLFSKNNVKSIIAPSGAFGIAVNLNLNNPFLPAALRNQFCAFDVNPRPDLYVARFSQAECDAAAGAAPGSAAYRVIGAGGFVPFDVDNNGTISAGEGYNPNPQVALSRRSVEAGPRISDFTTTVFDYKAGLRGAITDTINWDLSGSYGESEVRSLVQGFTLNSRFRQALLVNGTAAAPVCQDASNSCVPVNVFGSAGSISQAAAKFLVADSTVFVRTTLSQARGLISGEAGVTSPWARDSINFAVGGEYRRYGAIQRSDLLAQSGDLGGAGGAAPNIVGGYDVYEAIGEVSVPLVQDKPGFDMLQVNGGIRYSHYTVDTAAKPKFNTTTYKGELVWQPIRDLKIRGGYAHSVRAPNITELFSPQNTVLASLATDPCAGAAPTTNANLRAICLAQGAPAGTIGSITNPTASQANITTGGNPKLRPEVSNSYTFGAVLQPTFLSGFSATVDYYNIKITGAITVPAPGDLIAACFGNVTAASASNPACTVIRRNPLTGGLDGDPSIAPGLFGALTNQGLLKTDGIDVALNYRTPLAFAGDAVKLALSFQGNYTLHSKFKANAASAASLDRECVGYYSANCSNVTGSIIPQFQWNQRTTVSFGDIDVSLLWRHIDGMKYEPAQAAVDGGLFVGTGPTGGNGYYAGKKLDFNRIPAANYFDLALRFGLSRNLDVTINVQNMLDKKPPIVGNTAGATAFNSGNTYPSTYDALGRRYAVGAKVKF